MNATPQSATVVVMLLVGMLAIGGCREQPATPGSDDVRSRLTLASRAFAAGTSIPSRHGGDGEDRSPPLAWSGTPPGARTFALICDDIDAPTVVPWVHWVIFDLPGTATGLDQGVPREPSLNEPRGAGQGINDWGRGNFGYRGPLPPRGDGPHRYRFRLFAIDRRLALSGRVDAPSLLAALRGHVLDEAELIGTYERR